MKFIKWFKSLFFKEKMFGWIYATLPNTPELIVQVFEGATNCTTGDGKAYFTVPDFLGGKKITAIHARVVTAGTTGTMDIQIANVTDTVDLLSTLLTIDSAETGSETAATPYVINTANDIVEANDLWRIDIDAIHTTAAKGLIVRIQFTI